jgi:hypothetical protein
MQKLTTAAFYDTGYSTALKLLTTLVPGYLKWSYGLLGSLSSLI